MSIAIAKSKKLVKNANVAAKALKASKKPKNPNLPPAFVGEEFLIDGEFWRPVRVTDPQTEGQVENGDLDNPYWTYRGERVLILKRSK